MATDSATQGHGDATAGGRPPDSDAELDPGRRRPAAPAAVELGSIVEVATIRWSEQPNLLWVQLRTSSGAIGLGETYYLPEAVEAVVHAFAGEMLLGQPAGASGPIWSAIFSRSNFFGFAGAEMRALSAIDIALWDALGQSVGLPIWQLLGGRHRDSIQVYDTCVDAGSHQDWTRAMEDPAGLAEELAGQGYLGLKLWPWDRYAPRLDALAAVGPAGAASMGLVGSYLSPRQLAEGLSVFERARDRVGDRLELLIEGHSRWDLNMAIRIARAAEPLGMLWMEDIIQPESAKDLARLVRETSVPQAVSERLISRFRFREVLEERAAHVAMLDLAWTGGLSEGRRIAELASSYHLPFAPHDCTGPVTALANAHLALAMPNCITTEVVRGFVEGYYREVLDAPPEVHAGQLSVGHRPGLGAALTPELLASSTVCVRRTS